MASKELVDYVTEQRAKGYSDDTLRTVLMNAGYDKSTIEEALGAAKVQATSPTTIQGAPVAQTDFQQPTTSPNKAGKWGIAIAVIIVLVGGGTAFAYFNGYLAPSLSPDQVLAKMYANIPNIKTFAFSANATSTVYFDQIATPPTFPSGRSNFPTSTTTSIAMNGASDLSDIANPKESSTITASGNILNEPFSTAAEFILLNKAEYIKLDSLDFGTSTTPNPLTAIATFFTDQWFKFDPSEFAQQLGAQGIQIPSSTQFTATQVAQLRSDIVQGNIVSVNQALPDATIDGQVMYHYSLTVNTSSLANFMGSVLALLYGGTSSTLVTEQEQALQTQLNTIQFNNMEIWIGKNDFFPYRFTGEMSENVPTSPSQKLIDLAMTMQVNNYNQPITITAPSDAKDVATILKGFMGGFSASSTTSSGLGSAASLSEINSEGRDAQRISDLREVQNDLELYYNKYGYYPITASWSVMSADMIAADVVSASGIPNDPTAGKTYYYQDFSAGQSYTIGAKLEANNSALTNTPSVPGVPKGMLTCTIAGKEFCATL